MPFQSKLKILKKHSSSNTTQPQHNHQRKKLNTYKPHSIKPSDITNNINPP